LTPLRQTNYSYNKLHGINEKKLKKILAIIGISLTKRKLFIKRERKVHSPQVEKAVEHAKPYI